MRSILLMVLAIAAITAIGIADDRESLAPRWRVLLGFAVLGRLAAIEPSFLARVLRFPLIGLQFGLASDWLAVFFTALRLVGLVNAVNRADGKNGLVLGLCTGWLIPLALRAKPNDLPMIAAILAGVIALLFMNLRGRLFLGDGHPVIQSGTVHLRHAHLQQPASIILVVHRLPPGSSKA